MNDLTVSSPPASMSREKIKIKYFSRNRTTVFWNLDDYPIPCNADANDPLLIIRNIKSALHKLGLPWWMIDIMAYGKVDLDCPKITEFLCKTGIYEGENLDSITIPLDTLSVASATTRGLRNFVVIAKASPESQLLRVLRCLKSRNHVAILLELTDNTALNSVESLVASTQVIDGGEFARPSDEVYVDVDFARPLSRLYHDGGSDGFRWCIAYRHFKTSDADLDDDHDAFSCDWFFPWSY